MLGLEKLLVVMTLNQEWKITLYRSNVINKNNNIDFDYRYFYKILGNFIRQKINKYKECIERNKKLSYIPSEIKDSYRWRIIANKIDNDDNNYVILVTIRPEKNVNKKEQLTKQEVEDLLKEGLEIIEKLGDTITLQYRDVKIELTRLKYSSKNILDISNWRVILTEKESMTFENFIKTGINKVNEIMRNANINFVIVQDFLNDNIIKQQIINKLKDYGHVREIRHYKYNINTPTQQNPTTVYIIPLDMRRLDNQIKQKIIETKDFFINKQLAFQHISRFEALNNQYSFNNMLCEISAKTGLCRFYIDPSEIISDLDSFIFLNDIYSKKKGIKLLEVIYTFSGLRNISKERLLIFDSNDIQFSSTKYSIEFKDTKKLAEMLTETGNLVEEDMKIVIIFTKRPNSDNCKAIVKSFKELNIIVDRMYYIPPRWIRFVDEYILNPDDCSHPYLFLTERLAVLKPSTNLVIFPQLFNLPIELLYPLNTKIDESDLKKVLWLIKKRLYRYHNIKTLSLPEPIAIWRHNRSFLLSTEIKNIPLRYII